MTHLLSTQADSAAPVSTQCFPHSPQLFGSLVRSTSSQALPASSSGPVPPLPPLPGPGSSSPPKPMLMLPPLPPPLVPPSPPSAIGCWSVQSWKQVASVVQPTLAPLAIVNSRPELS